MFDVKSLFDISQDQANSIFEQNANDILRLEKLFTRINGEWFYDNKKIHIDNQRILNNVSGVA
jgi:hypothetical protein